MICLEIFENERRSPRSGWGAKHLWLHPHYSDESGWKDLFHEFHRSKPPDGYDWEIEWQVDLSHSQTDEEGWSYAMTYENLVSNCHQSLSLIKPGMMHNSRRRKWVRRAIPIMSSTEINRSEEMSTPRISTVAPTKILVEVFENERRMPMNGWSPKNLLRHPNFSDAQGKAKPSLSQLSPPTTFEWEGEWLVDMMHTQTDEEGWSYAIAYDFLISNCNRGTSIARPNVTQNSRRRRWVRCAIKSYTDATTISEADFDMSDSQNGRWDEWGYISDEGNEYLDVDNSSASATSPCASASIQSGSGKSPRPRNWSGEATRMENRPFSHKSYTYVENKLIVEVFENERRNMTGWSPRNLYVHPQFSDTKGCFMAATLSDVPLPPQYAWIDDWDVDTTHTQTDDDGWSYAIAYDYLISNCERNMSITQPNISQNSRRRRWVRTAMSVDGNGHLDDDSCSVDVLDELVKRYSSVEWKDQLAESDVVIHGHRESLRESMRVGRAASKPPLPSSGSSRQMFGQYAVNFIRKHIAHKASFWKSSKSRSGAVDDVEDDKDIDNDVLNELPVEILLDGVDRFANVMEGLGTNQYQGQQVQDRSSEVNASEGAVRDAVLALLNDPSSPEGNTLGQFVRMFGDGSLASVRYFVQDIYTHICSTRNVLLRRVHRRAASSSKESQGGHRHQRPLSRRQLRQLAADGGAVASDNTNLKTAEYRALWDASAVVSCIVFMVVEYKLFVELSPIIETILSSKRCPDDPSDDVFRLRLAQWRTRTQEDLVPPSLCSRFGWLAACEALSAIEGAPSPSLRLSALLRTAKFIYSEFKEERRQRMVEFNAQDKSEADAPNGADAGVAEAYKLSCAMMGPVSVDRHVYEAEAEAEVASLLRLCGVRAARCAPLAAALVGDHEVATVAKMLQLLEEGLLENVLFAAGATALEAMHVSKGLAMSGAVVEPGVSVAPVCTADGSDQDLNNVRPTLSPVKVVDGKLGFEANGEANVASGGVGDTIGAYPFHNCKEVPPEPSENHESQENIPELNGDDFLCIFIFVLSRCELRTPVLTKEVLWSLCSAEMLRGEAGYYLTVFEAAVAHINSDGDNAQQSIVI